MGALSFVTPRLKRILGSKLRSIKRAANSTPATGSAKAHELEQKTLITLALGKPAVNCSTWNKHFSTNVFFGPTLKAHSEQACTYISSNGTAWSAMTRLLS